MVSQASRRAVFITSLIQWVRRHGFDGFDLDWEFPADVELGGRPEDRTNLVVFMRELRQAVADEATTGGKEPLLVSSEFTVTVSGRRKAAMKRGKH